MQTHAIVLLSALLDANRRPMCYSRGAYPSNHISIVPRGMFRNKARKGLQYCRHRVVAIPSCKPMFRHHHELLNGYSQYSLKFRFSFGRGTIFARQSSRKIQAFLLARYHRNASVPSRLTHAEAILPSTKVYYPGCAWGWSIAVLGTGI